jgi:hypothetical protein
MGRIRKHVSPGVVLGVVALVIALAGTSIALPGKGSVDGNDLKKKSVGAKALRATSTQTRTESVAQGAYGEQTVPCPGGQQLISGGGSWDNTAKTEFTPVVESNKEANGWHVRAFNGHTAARTLTVYAYCLKK